MGDADLVVRVLTAVGKRVGTPPGNDREMLDSEMLNREMLDNILLGEVLGKSGNAVAELRDILRPVGITRDVLRSLFVPDSDSSELRDGVRKLRDGILEL